MSRVIIYLLMLIVGQVFAQQSAEELKVKQTVDTFFEGFHKGDTAMVKSVLADKILLQTTYTDKDGVNHLKTDDIAKLLTAIANRPANQKWDERLLNYTIKVDGGMANAWTPYEFYVNDTFSHCGVNSFQMFKDNGQWKVIYLIDTRRKQGCRD